MRLLTTARIVRWGLLHFRRNIWLSLASTGVLLLTLAVLALLLLVTVVGGASLQAIEEKVDITVFMADATSEEAILAVKTDLEGRPDVASVQYVTKEQALAAFRARHEANPVIAQALQEIGENPLQASLVVKATAPQAYFHIADALKSPKYQSFVSRVTAEDNRIALKRLSTVLQTARRVGLLLAGVLAIIAILVTFNTIRLAIYGTHEEIEIMRLVGASPWFIKGPFLIEGALTGAIAGIVTILYFFPFARALSPRVAAFVEGGQFDLARWVTGNALVLALIFLMAGILLSVLSSWAAVRRYVH